jgi:integrase
MAAGPYPTANGFQVKWREDGRWQSDTFASTKSSFDDDGNTIYGADEFKALVEKAGNRWPKDQYGQQWIRGEGFPPPPAEQDPGTPFLEYARQRILTRVGIGKVGPHMSRKYEAYAKTIAGSLLLAPTLVEEVQADPELAMRTALDPMAARPLLLNLVGSTSDEELSEYADSVTVEDLDLDAIRAFILWQRVRPKYPKQPASEGLGWKTIKNYHGFLHGVLEQAFYENLISKNPCKFTATELGTEVRVHKISLEPEEFWLIHSCMDVRFHRLLEAAVGTGCRFGEITASRPKDWRSDIRRLRVAEAWKKGLKGEDYYRGKPKTEAGLRDIYVGHRVAEVLDEAARDKAEEDLLFTAVKGGRLRQNAFYEEYWQPAIKRAVAQGLEREGVPIYPRFHDLRHTHIYWLRRGGLANELIRGMVGHADEDRGLRRDPRGGQAPGDGCDRRRVLAAAEAAPTARRVKSQERRRRPIEPCRRSVAVAEVAEGDFAFFAFFAAVRFADSSPSSRIVLRWARLKRTFLPKRACGNRPACTPSSSHRRDMPSHSAAWA